MMYGRNQQSPQHCKAFILQLKHKNNTDSCNCGANKSQIHRAGQQIETQVYSLCFSLTEPEILL